MHPEKVYLSIMKTIIDDGELRQTRNAKTYSMFGGQMVFDLKNGVFPLMTTKKIPFRLIFEELLFFMRGQTDNSILVNKNVGIWTANTSREFIDNMSLKYEHGELKGQPYLENDMGPMYGIQMRSYGCGYKGKNHNHIGEGFDQLAEVIRLIKTDPTSRRILMTMINPIDATKSVLHCCHGSVIQFYVEKQKYLCCHMYQRSSDMFLGSPFNQASYSLMVYILCELINNSDDYTGTKLEPGKLIISLGDIHVYEEHLDAVKTQLSREPFDYPRLSFKRPIKSLDDIKWDDILLENYKSHDIIKAPMIA